MHILVAQQSPEVDETDTVELERLDGCSADGCHTNDARIRIIPSEMLFPLMKARMEQRNLFVTFGISGRCPYVLVVVTALTREREIVYQTLTAATPRPDVFD